MPTVDEQIRNIDRAICQNIDQLANDRALLSMNILAQVRNLIEATAVRVQTNSGTTELNYAAIGPAIKFVGSKADYRFLGRFHKLLQASASHYTLDGDASERLMLRYYELLYRIRELLGRSYGMRILRNLEDFPVDLDVSLHDYHQVIATKIQEVRRTPQLETRRTRYYIHKIKPFFVEGRVYYELTFYSALDRVSKFDRIIAFTDLEVSDGYACYLTLTTAWIETLGQDVPVAIATDWEVAIRPCELNNFGRIFGLLVNTHSGTSEYRSVMHYLTMTGGTLIDLVQLPVEEYSQLRTAGVERMRRPQIFAILDAARILLSKKLPGVNIIRYLMLHMKNQVIKQQFDPNPCGFLSRLRLRPGCNPFETMPFCTSLINHNPRLADLLQVIETDGRAHELLARRIKNNVENRGMLYTPISELTGFDDLDQLITDYNSRLYRTHGRRRIIMDMGHVFILEHEDDTAAIIERLQDRAASGIAGYAEAVARWLEEPQLPIRIDDPAKAHALEHLFSRSRVALVYGAAGTGKSTMVNYVSSYFNDRHKLFLAHTNPAVDNLKRRVSAQNSTFRTISSHLSRRPGDTEYDLLVIDECSTVSNSDLIKVLKATRFKLLLLVGDIYQIEAIQFGNWFSSARSFLPPTSVFELTTPFRTTNKDLLKLWNKVRTLADDVSEELARGGYSSLLDSSLFARQANDEIILCLNYDGLYGINNINRLMQSANHELSQEWNGSRYKINDPVLFNEIDRFKPVIYNNLKGRITGIHLMPDRHSIWFDVELDRGVTAFDVEALDLQWLGGSTVRFEVHEHSNGDDDDNNLKMIVPFQIAYAVSIHKAQGLEYGSVKIVITHDNEDNVSHNVFYTAITRARDTLRLYWTPETQHQVLSTLEHRTHRRDVDIIANRRRLEKA